MILTSKSISVVLGVYNQGHLLIKTLELWKKVCLSYKAGSELIICDDGSDDETEDVIVDFMDRNANCGLMIMYLRKDRAGTAELSANLNQALPYISGKYTLFAMGDSYPTSRLLESYGEKLDPRTVLSGLRQGIQGLFDYSNVTPDYRYNSVVYTSISEVDSPWEGFTGNNFVIPTGMLLSLGGFNEVFKGYGAEDWELAALAYYKECASFMAVPDAKVYHVNHTPREGSGDPGYYYASVFYSLLGRYREGNFDRTFGEGDSVEGSSRPR